jgi:spore coat protein U-like protein
MSSGANKLSYNLYTDTNHNYVWGDGTGGTSTDSDSYYLSILTARNYPVYGLIPSGQNAAAGSYADTIIVTVSY